MKHTPRMFRIVSVIVLALAACTTSREKSPGADELAQTIHSSFRARGQAGLERLQQTEMQRLCSSPSPDQLPAAVRQRLQREALEAVRYPDDDRWLGNWQRGEKIAQSGVGLQFSDPPDAPRGGNCYACHQLSGTELAFGTIGPSLNHYLERYGGSPDAMRQTWVRIWNPHALNACSLMPRFGDAGILTADQIRDVMALLFDPQSPVNR
jgi:L-cysteine S-thiosulfotransferase